MMFSFLSRQKTEEGLLSEAQARAFVEAELARRNWRFPEARGYSLKRVDGRMVWRCMSFAHYTPGGGRLMGVDVDARTGEVVYASNGRREGGGVPNAVSASMEKTIQDA